MNTSFYKQFDIFLLILLIGLSFLSPIRAEGSYSISGTVTTSAGSAVPGVLMTLSGTLSGTTTTDSSGSYSFTGLTSGSYSITASQTGLSLTPTNMSVSVSNASVTGQNFTSVAQGDPYVDIYNGSKTCNGTTLFTVVNGQSGRIIEADMTGKIVWQYTIPSSLSGAFVGLDAEVLSNNDILFESSGYGIYEIDRNGNIVWSYADAKADHDADRLSNGNTLYVHGNNDTTDDSQVKEINSQGQLVWSWNAKNDYVTKYPFISAQGWTHINHVQRMSNGNTLVSLRNFDLTSEIAPDGSVVWSFDWSSLGGTHPIFPAGPELLSNNNLLVCLQNTSPYDAVEINRNTGGVVWSYTYPSGPPTLRTTQDCDRLANGNTLLASVLTSGSTTSLSTNDISVLLEVTPAGEIVWELKLLGVLTGNQPCNFFKVQRIGCTATSNYILTATSGSNGSISPAGRTVVSSGASQTYTITPFAGYVVANLLVDGASVGAANTYTFSNVTANHTISATFSAGGTLTITQTGMGTGTVTSSDSKITCGTTCSQQYSQGSTVTLSAIPNSGVTFGGWSGATCTGTGTCSFTLNTDTTVNADFRYGSFDDELNNVFAPYIEAIKTAGITVGCGNGNYCPSNNVTRGQMAAFIIRALFGENFQYATAPYFTDELSTDSFFKYIQKMKDAGITAVSGTYNPGGIVTREQMAAFLVRAAQVKNNQTPEGFTCNGGVSGASLSCSTTQPYFSDVASTDGFFSYVQKLKEMNITTMTGSYNPNQYVTRDMMAAFLSRAFLGMK